MATKSATNRPGQSHARDEQLIGALVPTLLEGRPPPACTPWAVGADCLPAAARRMYGIEAGPPVLLAASVPQDTLVIHPASTVARLLAEYHARLEGARDDR